MNYVDLVTEVLKNEVQYVEKQVPCIETETIERAIEVPQMLYEERAVECPQVQTCEFSRQELHPVIQQVVKEIPKVKMEYVEKVVEVSSKVSAEFANVEFDRVDRYTDPWQRQEQVLSSRNFLPRGAGARTPSPQPVQVQPVPLPIGQPRVPMPVGWLPPGSSRQRSTSPLSGRQGGSMTYPAGPRGFPCSPIMSPGRGGQAFGQGVSGSMRSLPGAGDGSWMRGMPTGYANGYAERGVSPMRGRVPSPLPQSPYQQPKSPIAMAGPYVGWPPQSRR